MKNKSPSPGPKILIYTASDMEHDQHMPESKTELCLLPSRSPAAQLRKIGLIVLLAGFAIAGMIYALVPEDTSSEDNSLLTEYHDKQEVAVQRMWGRRGVFNLGTHPKSKARKHIFGYRDRRFSPRFICLLLSGQRFL